MKRTVLFWLFVGLFGFAMMPWHMTDAGFFSFEWLTDGAPSTGLWLVLAGQWWLAPIGGALIAIGAIGVRVPNPVPRAKMTVAVAAIGIIWMALQGLIIVRAGPRLFEGILTGDAILAGQPGMGVGAALCIMGLLFALTVSMSQTGKGRGDAFVVSTIGLIIVLVGVFVFFPVMHILVRAFEVEGGYSLSSFFPRFFSSDIWGLRCLVSDRSCGVAINSLFLAVLTGLGTTMLGLSFALIFTRTDFRAKKILRILTVIPIITPPFVIGLALILLFGRNGTVTAFAAELFGMEKTRWLYGFWGVYFAQLLSFTPIAFLVLIGVVQGVSPSMEEASQTLDADRWQTFRYVSLPLMRPGLANAFLLGFIESLADFGNPLVLGSG